MSPVMRHPGNTADVAYGHASREATVRAGLEQKAEYRRLRTKNNT